MMHDSVRLQITKTMVRQSQLGDKLQRVEQKKNIVFLEFWEQTFQDVAGLTRLQAGYWIGTDFNRNLFKHTVGSMCWIQF